MAQITTDSNAWVLVTKGKKQKPKNSGGAPASQMNVNSNANPSLETVAESDSDSAASDNDDSELSSVPSVDTARSIYSQADMDAVLRAHKKEIETLRVAQAVNLRNTEGKLNATFEAKTAALVTQSQKQAEDIASLNQTVQQLMLMISELTTTVPSQLVVHSESALATQNTPPRAAQLKRDTNNQEANLNVTPSRAASAPKKSKTTESQERDHITEAPSTVHEFTDNAVEYSSIDHLPLSPRQGEGAGDP